ncbi:MAG: hypothetical protein SF029_24660, partial [bacterium]|nr:hypothetical protein [bacterium]
QPFIVNWFNSHRDLCWKDDQTQIDALRPAGSSINNIGRVGVFRDDELHVGYEVTHTLEFHIDNEDDFYYGD